MLKRKTLDLPLHYGKCPPWLFAKMKRLARIITEYIIYEKGPEGFLEKISDPYFFQSLGCVLAFDWHSSGLTTTVCGAIKEGLRGAESSLGLYTTGGKGNTSRKTPDHIKAICEHIGRKPDRLIYASRMSAKVDSACVQDGYDLYQHSFFFTKKGTWAVIQQGMNQKNRYARRYHWFSPNLDSFVCEPHAGICCDRRTKTLNLVAKESEGARKKNTDISHNAPDKTINLLGGLRKSQLPMRHSVVLDDINPKHLARTLLKTYENPPQDFESLILTEGVGPKTVRALSLISELIYHEVPSFQDPARFSFAHGGKDGYPYPVDQRTYESSINILQRALRQAKIGRTDKIRALNRLSGRFLLKKTQDKAI